ncbi:MAG: TIGR04076 family protein [Anaerolineae bacterium]
MGDYPLEIKVVDIMGQGTCHEGLKVGDIFSSDRELAQACPWAAYILLPLTTALRFGGDVPWEQEPGLARACCMDAANPVVFEVRRV